MSVTIVGGAPHPSFKIEFTGSPPVSDEVMTQQKEQAKTLGLPEINTSPTFIKPKGRRLAVIGGGPSIEDNLDKIRDWDGDRWSIGGAYDWCRARGIETTFLACDPHPIVAQWAHAATKAIVTSRCHPKVFEVLKANNADVQTFDLEGDGRIVCGSSTATAVPHIAALSGYDNITFFGCEGSYELHKTHAYMREVREAELLVGVGDQEFYTAPDFLMQSMEMRHILKIAPHVFFEESGGLLRALVKSDGEYRLLWISEGMHERLKPKEEQAA
jgi:hypothetical protein